MELHDIVEAESWIEEVKVKDEAALAKKIDVFKQQIFEIKLEVKKLTINTSDLVEKLEVVQQISTHLSFHLGEMILLLRQNKHYPQPHEMKFFLQDK